MRNVITWVVQYHSRTASCKQFWRLAIHCQVQQWREQRRLRRPHNKLWRAWTSVTKFDCITRKWRIWDGDVNRKWAATWQNQQSDCAPIEDSDQPGHPPSLIRVFAVGMKKAWVLSYPLSAQRRFWSECPGWSESSLSAQSLCWFCYVAAQMTKMLTFC